jgi:putative oxidoreductase
MHYLIHKTSHLFLKLEFYGWPLLLLVMRFWMARIFWRSGKVKIKHWDSTLSLFKFEYKVPYIPSDLAAFLTTAFELICPVLLVVGLMTRLATLPLLVITAVIQFTYLPLQEHAYWGILLGTLLFKGAGPLSLDNYFYKRL